MELSPRQPVNSAPFFVSGDVSIHPSAVIASGVLLQAEENSRIVIGAGVCIGTGTVIHAYEGTLEVEEHVTLGVGVLIVGQGKIEAKACVGSVTTLFNHSVQPKQVVSAQSLLGVPSRQIQAEPVQDLEPPIEPETQSQPSPSLESKVITESQSISISQTSIEFESSTEVTTEPRSEEQIPPEPSEPQTIPELSQSSETEEKSLKKDKQAPVPKSSNKTNQVYGQVYLNQMLIKLLPHRQDLGNSSQDSDED